MNKANPAPKRYPYLLKDVLVADPDEVWCADITYIRLWHGLVYLVAIMDWHSRYVLAWDISITLDAAFLKQAA